MSHAQQHWIFPPDVTQPVQEKINLLRDTTSQIMSMEKELTRLKLQKTELEKELACYRLEASALRLGPIARCPDEVLLLIFKQFLVFNHSQIRKLLFICKQWYDIVMSSPHLWARIEVKDASTLFNYKNYTSPSKIPYVVACYERSRSLLMDVELDLRKFPSVEEYLGGELYRVAQEITDIYEHGDIHEKIYDEDWECSSKWIDNELSRTLEYILGANEVHVSRWKSLVLSLPHHGDPASSVWRRIRRSSARVIQLKISNIFYDWQEEEEIDQADPPYLPLLQHLTFEGTPQLMHSYLGAFPTTFENLEIIIFGPSFFVQLSILSASTNLRTLTLHIQGLVTQSSQSNPSEIDLPQLEVLNLYAISEHVGPRRTSTDRIQSTTEMLLQRACAIHQASPRRINWHFYARRIDGTEVVNTSREITMLSDEASMHTLQEWARQQVLDAAQNIGGNVHAEILMVRSERVNLRVQEAVLS